MILDHIFYSFYKRAEKSKGQEYVKSPAIFLMSFLLTFNFLVLVSITRNYYVFTFRIGAFVPIFFIIVCGLLYREKRCAKIIEKFSMKSDKYLLVNKIVVNIYFFVSILLLLLFFKPTLLGW
jgi:hypothetical protein